MKLFFSFIIPVYNRPEEVSELLASLMAQTYGHPFEIVIVEDGSTLSSQKVVEAHKVETDYGQSTVSISYYTKDNSGPGDSRNFGMRKAKGDYFIILDSDCILPEQYLETVAESLKEEFVHCFGGPDAAHSSFSMIQKAINYAMTSVLTTGGLRGTKKSMGRPTSRQGGFQPRSFNMGISKEAFVATGGFGNIHPGEDPDLTFRIWKSGYPTKLIPEAFVYHKRRIDWKKFYNQVKKFGKVRPILTKWHPNTAKMTYWFPTFFVLAFLASLVFWAIGIRLPLYLYMVYFATVLIDCLIKTKNLSIALLSVLVVALQFTGYGYGFLKSTILVNFSRRKPEELFPELFF